MTRLGPPTMSGRSPLLEVKRTSIDPRHRRHLWIGIGATARSIDCSSASDRDRRLRLRRRGPMTEGEGADLFHGFCVGEVETISALRVCGLDQFSNTTVALGAPRNAIWRLLPDSGKPQKLINAKYETVRDLPIFRDDTAGAAASRDACNAPPTRRFVQLN